MKSVESATQINFNFEVGLFGVLLGLGIIVLILVVLSMVNEDELVDDIDIDEIHEAYDLFDQISDMEHPNPLVREKACAVAEAIEDLLECLESESEHEGS